MGAESRICRTAIRDIASSVVFAAEDQLSWRVVALSLYNDQHYSSECHPLLFTALLADRSAIRLYAWFSRAIFGYGCHATCHAGRVAKRAPTKSAVPGKCLSSSTK